MVTFDDVVKFEQYFKELPGNKICVVGTYGSDLIIFDDTIKEMRSICHSSP